MEGPRTLLPHEFDSLDQLLDSVFFGGAIGEMRGRFPQFLSEANRENLFVFAEGDRIVSHAGMMYRWATIAGCLVRVALIGSVATYAEQRGQRLASQLVETAWNKASADGADFLLISGDLNIYRRAGAAIVGRLQRTDIEIDAANSLARQGVRVRDFEENDLPFCAGAYRTRPVRFLRPLDDWEALMSYRFAIRGPARVFLVEDGGMPVAYVACVAPDKEGLAKVMEFAGEQRAVAAAIPLIMRDMDAPRFQMYVEESDAVLTALLANAHVPVTPAPAEGTVRLVNAGQLVERMRPYIEERIGIAAASDLRCEVRGDTVVFSLGDDVYRATGPLAAAEFLFGTPEGGLQGEGKLQKAFPLPALWFGLNFV